MLFNQDLAREKFVTALKFIKMYEFQSAYKELHILHRILVTLPTGSAKCERAKAFFNIGTRGQLPPNPEYLHLEDFFFIEEARFFQKEDCLESRPNVETYKNRGFVSNFFKTL